LNWAEFGKKPSGTGPFKITRVVPVQYIEMVRNEEYWDKERVPKLEKLVVMPMAEATTRIAALRSGQVDWIEVPAPDSIPSLKAAGYTVTLWPYPHTYPYCLNTEDDSPFKDVRVRRAMNYAIDREGLCSLLNGHDLGVTTFLIRGFNPLADNIAYGRDLLPLTRQLIAERTAARAA
jgi:ABC-type transport system substrate-binding protein